MYTRTSERSPSIRLLSVAKQVHLALRFYDEAQGNVPESLQDLVSPEILPAGDLLRYPNQEDFSNLDEPMSQWSLEWQYFPEKFGSPKDPVIVAPLPHWSKNALGLKSKPQRIVVFGDGAGVLMQEEEFLAKFGGLLTERQP